MCTYSMIADHYKDKWSPLSQYVYPQTTPLGTPWPAALPDPEIAKIREELADMKKLLLKAIEYDKKNGSPHCEMKEKVDFLKKVAEFVGVDIKEIIQE
jgi:hypothetical protein